MYALCLTCIEQRLCTKLYGHRCSAGHCAQPGCDDGAGEEDEAAVRFSAASAVGYELGRLLPQLLYMSTLVCFLLKAVCALVLVCLPRVVLGMCADKEVLRCVGQLLELVHPPHIICTAVSAQYN